MINHVRTLLRNRSYGPWAGDDGGELVDPGYRVVTLPPALDAVRAVLFGSRPDAAGLDFRLRQYTTLLHATELAADVVAADPRVTYPAAADGLGFDPTPAVAPAGHDAPLYVAGGTVVDDNSGALSYTWQVTAGDPATVERVAPGHQVATPAAGFAGGLSAPLPLVGSGLTARFNSGLTGGTSWTVSALARPRRDLGDVLAALDGLAPAILAALFAGDPPADRWRAIWEASLPLPYRLGAALLALAGRTDAVRKGG
jgi:hypothetical protein